MSAAQPNELELASERVQEYIERHSAYLEFFRGLKFGISSVRNLSELDDQLTELNARRASLQAHYHDLSKQFADYDAKQPSQDDMDYEQEQLELAEQQRDHLERQTSIETDKLLKVRVLEDVLQNLQKRISIVRLEIKTEEELRDMYKKAIDARQTDEKPESGKWVELQKLVAQTAKEYQSA